VIAPELRYDGIFELKLHPGEGLCPVKGCRNAPGVKKGGLCNKHHQRLFKHRHPQAWGFNIIKAKSKRRGIAFTISFDYYCGLTDAYAYHEQKPEEHGDWLTIDRRDITKGYEPGNLRILTHSENVAAGNAERFLPETVRALLERRRALAASQEAAAAVPEYDPETCPF
jgi:hypothetical protein